MCHSGFTLVAAQREVTGLKSHSSYLLLRGLMESVLFSGATWFQLLHGEWGLALRLGGTSSCAPCPQTIAHLGFTPHPSAPAESFTSHLPAWHTDGFLEDTVSMAHLPRLFRAWAMPNPPSHPPRLLLASSWFSHL